MGDGTWRGNPSAEQLARGADDWLLFLQLGSDRALDWMWGDEGLLYFALRKEDMRRGAFDGVGALVTKTLVGLNVLVYVITAAQGSGLNTPGGSLFTKWLLFGPDVANGDWWRLITSAFLHASLLHIAFNMYFLWFVGAPVEAALGRVRFILIYLISGLAGSAGALVDTPDQPTVGASGALFGILGAALVLERQRDYVLGGSALALIVIGSLVALALSDLPRIGLLTLLVDIYLILLLVAITNHLQLDAPGVRAVLVVWTVAALAWTAILIGAHYGVLPQTFAELLELKPNAKRASGPTGNNPNLAGSYLVASFFVLLASPWPRRRPFRMLAGGWLLLGEVATGSLGGLLGLGVGTAVLATGAYLRAGHTAEQVRALLGAALLAGSVLVA